MPARFRDSPTSAILRNINDGSHDAFPTVTRLENDLLVVGWENNANSNTDTIIALVDPATGIRLETRQTNGGQPVADDVGDITVAGSANGRIQVFHTNNTDSDVDGETLVGRRTSLSDGAGDTITGDEFIDFMHGNAGNDTLLGGGNNDFLYGGNQNDTLNGGAGDDFLFGDAHDDTLIGRAGADALNGGLGTDTANYTASPAAVNVNLTAGIGSGGDATGDTLIYIEKIIGSAFNDTLTGAETNDMLTGGNGIDTLKAPMA